MVFIRSPLSIISIFLSFVTAIISDPPVLTNTAATAWVTTAGFTIDSDAWSWQQWLIASAYSGVPDEEYSTCSSAYISDFLGWASQHPPSAWTSYGTNTLVETTTLANKSGVATYTSLYPWYAPYAEGAYMHNYTEPCCGFCTVYADTVRLYYWQNLTSTNESIVSTAIIEDKYTVTYPSAFLVFDTVSTEDLCQHSTTFNTQLGYPVATDGMFYLLQGVRTSGMPIGAGNLGYTKLPFDYWAQKTQCDSLKAQGSSDGYVGTTITGTSFAYNPCFPQISAPAALFSAVPGWDTCEERGIWYRGSADPPHTLTPQAAIQTTNEPPSPASTIPPPAQQTSTSEALGPSIELSSNAIVGPAPETTTSSQNDPQRTAVTTMAVSSPNAQPDTTTTSTSAAVVASPGPSQDTTTTSQPAIITIAPGNQQVTTSASTSAVTVVTAGQPVASSNNLPQQQDPSIPKFTSTATPQGNDSPVTVPGLASASAVYTTDTQGQGEIVLSSTTIVQGASAVTISGVRVSLGSSEVVIGSQTKSFTAATVATITSNGVVTTASSSSNGVGNAIMSAWTAAAGGTTSGTTNGTSLGNGTIITGDGSKQMVSFVWSAALGMAVIALV